VGQVEKDRTSPGYRNLIRPGRTALLPPRRQSQAALTKRIPDAPGNIAHTSP